MNKTILSGRLTKDPEIRYSSNAENPTAVARFTLAVQRKFKKQNDAADADFIQCVSFGRTAEFLEKYGKKGIKFNVCGRIETGKYINQNGYDVYYTHVVVEEVEFAESKSSNAADQNQPRNIPPEEGFMEIPEGIEEELPFN